MPNPFSLPMARRSLRNVVGRPATRRYPTEQRPRFSGARGTLELNLWSCVFCGLCVRRCPAAALECSREEQWFAVDQLRCISCGVCVDVCNKDSLSLTVTPPRIFAATEAGPVAPRPGRREWRKEASQEAAPDAADAEVAEPAKDAAA